jgi:hypothetical protein
MYSHLKDWLHGRLYVSQQVIAVKFSCPLLLAVNSCFLQFSDFKTFNMFFYRLVIVIPLLAIAAWSIFVPQLVHSDEGTDVLTVVGWRTSEKIAFEDVAYIQRRISVFDSLVLKSGRRILYISDEANRHLLIGPKMP